MTYLYNDPLNSVEEGRKRVAYMEYLFWLDGRDNPDHPQHSTFTGLFEERGKTLAKQEQAAFAKPVS